MSRPPFSTRGTIVPTTFLRENLFGRIAEEAVSEAIGEGQIALGVHAQDNAIDALDQFAVLVLRSLEFRAGADPLASTASSPARRRASSNAEINCSRVCP